jgi:hypothetical protein
MGSRQRKQTHWEIRKARAALPLPLQSGSEVLRPPSGLQPRRQAVSQQQAATVAARQTGKRAVACGNDGLWENSQA